jgi:DNA-binding transcriptional regulator YhcF (GntR family)
MSDQMEAPVSVAVGTWIGREQAFNALAQQCSSARVACLKQVRDTEAYKSLNLTWEEFCPEHAGISRSQADRLISQLSQFGAPYFQLTDIVPVSPAVYREIEPAIVDGTIEFRGEHVPITRENATKIKAAVYALRKAVERAESENLVRSRPNITSLQIRFDAYCEDIRRLIHHAKFEESKPAVRALLVYSAGKINELTTQA